MTLPEATEMLARWTPPGMVLIPAGPFTMGSTERSQEGPVHEVWLGAFWIDRTPVINAQWAAFLAGDAWQRKDLWTEAGWKWRKGERLEPDEWEEHKGKRDHPVRGICWYEALAYARWAGKGLLSEAQWEKAARGGDGRRYPWGDDFDSKKCNTLESGAGDTTPVGSHSPQGDSPYGLADMAGNVWEWCCNLYVPYEYKAADGREVLEGTGSRVLRGGSFLNYGDSARSAYRNFNVPYSRYGNRGVRVGVAAPFSLPSGL
jgi:formylglycine-generating enzyme required for sulfatase activity